MIRTEDRDFFGGYYLSDDGVHLFGCIPYHSVKCGMVGDQHLLYCLFSTRLLNDVPSGVVQESADMSADFADYFVPPHIGLFDNLSPYSLAVVNKDLQNGLTDDQVIELRGFIIHPKFAGKTWNDVCLRFPVEYVDFIDEEGNSIKQPSHWKFQEE